MARYLQRMNLINSGGFYEALTLHHMLFTLQGSPEVIRSRRLLAQCHQLLRNQVGRKKEEGYALRLGNFAFARELEKGSDED